MPRADGVEVAVITQPPAGRIFLSYRRTDAQHIAGRLFDRLEARFGSGNVFMDVDSIEPGLDHGEAIDKAVGSRDVRALGDYQQARAIHEDTLARRQRVLGEDHPSTLITAQSLVADLEAVGAHEQARTLAEDIVVRRQRLGNDRIPRLPIDRPTKASGRFDEG